jgi:hypothetical protein
LTLEIAAVADSGEVVCPCPYYQDSLRLTSQQHEFERRLLDTRLVAAQPRRSLNFTKGGVIIGNGVMSHETECSTRAQKMIRSQKVGGTDRSNKIGIEVISSEERFGDGQVRKNVDCRSEEHFVGLVTSNSDHFEKTCNFSSYELIVNPQNHT